MARLRTLLLLALLPGLLLSGGSSVRVCLHALFGGGADCVECALEVAPCCGGGGASEEASASPEGSCASCCIELEGSRQSIAAKERAADGATSALALAPARPLALPVPVEARVAPVLEPASARRSPSAPGILPLRI